MNAKLEICKQCDELGELDKCRICGCFMQMKTVMPFTTCPLGKWEILKTHNTEELLNDVRKSI